MKRTNTFEVIPQSAEDAELLRRLLTRALVREPTNREGYVYWLSALGGGYTYRPAQAAKRWAVRQFA